MPRRLVSSYTPAELRRLVRRWVKEYLAILGMGGWRVDVAFSIPDDADAYGAAWVEHPEYLYGCLYVNLSAYRRDRLSIVDLEQTVVHELLELELWPIKMTTRKSEAYGESSIQRISRAIVGLRRGVDPVPVEQAPPAPAGARRAVLRRTTGSG